jgi:hypothetical protein
VIVRVAEIPAMATACGWWLHEPGRRTLRSVSLEAEGLWFALVDIVLSRLDRDPLALITDEVLALAECRTSTGLGRLFDELISSRLVRPVDPSIPDAAPPTIPRRPALVFDFDRAAVATVPSAPYTSRWVPGPLDGWELAGSPTSELVEFLDTKHVPLDQVEACGLEVRRDADGGWLIRTGAWS